MFIIVYIFSGSNQFIMFAKAAILTNCKIQTMCVKTNIIVSFTPPEVTDEDCLKILYYHHQNVTMCQRVVDIRMNEGIKELRKGVKKDCDLYRKEREEYFIRKLDTYNKGMNKKY